MSRFYLALTYTELGQQDHALELLDHIREASPTDVDLLLRLAQLYEKLDQSIHTLQLLERARAQDPDNPRVNFSIGLLQSGAKRYP